MLASKRDLMVRNWVYWWKFTGLSHRVLCDIKQNLNPQIFKCKLSLTVIFILLQEKIIQFLISYTTCELYCVNQSKWTLLKMLHYIMPCTDCSLHQKIFFITTQIKKCINFICMFWKAICFQKYHCISKTMWLFSITWILHILTLL